MPSQFGYKKVVNFRLYSLNSPSTVVIVSQKRHFDESAAADHLSDEKVIFVFFFIFWLMSKCRRFNVSALDIEKDVGGNFTINNDFGKSLASFFFFASVAELRVEMFNKLWWVDIVARAENPLRFKSCPSGCLFRLFVCMSNKFTSAGYINKGWNKSRKSLKCFDRKNQLNHSYSSDCDQQLQLD